MRFRGRDGDEGVAVSDGAGRESIIEETVAELTRAAYSLAKFDASFVDGARVRIAGAGENDAFFHGRLDGQRRTSTHRLDARRDDRDALRDRGREACLIDDRDALIGAAPGDIGAHGIAIYVADDRHVLLRA